MTGPVICLYRGFHIYWVAGASVREVLGAYGYVDKRHEGPGEPRFGHGRTPAEVLDAIDAMETK